MRMNRTATPIAALLLAPLLFVFFFFMAMAPTVAHAEKKEKKVAQAPGDKTAAAPGGVGELDLLEGVEVEKLVVEALKSETTVQEAPAIITVLTGQQIREQGYRTAAHAIGAVPGFNSYELMWSVEMTANARGLLSGALYLMDGLDLSDPIQNWANLGDQVPIEMINRIELISGPGGVLWGANSFLGVINVVTRTADDLEGVEASVGWGTGPGRGSDFRTYVMGGQKLWKDRIKFLLHASFESYYPPELDFPFNASYGRYTSPYPQGPMVITGPMTTSASRTQWINVTGNAQVGPLSAHWGVPLVIATNPANFTGGGISHDLGEDSIDCTDPANKAICNLRVDPSRVGRDFGGKWGMGAYRQTYAFVRYQDRLLKDKLRLDGRVSWSHTDASLAPYVSIRGSSLLKSGVTVEQLFVGNRVGGSLDADVALPWKLRLLAGGELLYDWLPEVRANFLTDKEVIETRLPYVCPEYYGQYIEGKTCPIIAHFAANRLTGGGFLDLQRRLLPNLSLELGGRVQASGGGRPLDPVFLMSGGVVWGFLPNWNLKLNYADGYRPPVLYVGAANGEAVNYSGNPDLRVERSRAVQGEVNAVLLKGFKSIRQLAFRADYAYTWVTDFINVISGTFQNTGERGIHSAEFLADLNLRQGHSFSLAYTFLDISDSDRGKVRTVPNQWMTARVLLNLWNRQLYLSSNLQVRASAEDPNKYPATPTSKIYAGDVEPGPDGNPVPKQTDAWTARVTDITLDRMPPAAIWNAGLRYLFKKPRLVLSFDAYNILNGQFWGSEMGYDPAAYLEFTPYPMEKFSFFASARYTY